MITSTNVNKVKIIYDIFIYLRLVPNISLENRLVTNLYLHNTFELFFESSILVLVLLKCYYLTVYELYLIMWLYIYYYEIASVSRNFSIYN